MPFARHDLRRIRPADDRFRSAGIGPARLALGSLLAVACALPWLVPPVAAAPDTARDVRFAIIGDRTGSAQPGIYESVLREIALFGPEFVVSVGDQIEGYTEDAATLEHQWSEMAALVKGLPAPFHWCVGNHDITSDGMVEAYRRATGVDPCYSFDHAGLHFVMIDTGRWESTGEWIEKSGYLDWLQADLSGHRDARMTIVVFHKPYWFDTLAEGKPDPLHQLFVEEGVDAVFNGHFHVYGHAAYDGIPYTIVGSSGGATDGEDLHRGTFYQWLWCVARGDSLDWMVMRRDGMLAPDAVTVADLKFFHRVGAECIRAEAIADPGRGRPAAGVISVRNILAEPWAARLRWSVTPGWSITPGDTDLALDPDAGATATFEARREGAIYPLPVLRAELPYREGRSYTHSLPLPWRRTHPASRVKAAPAIDGRLDDSCWSGAIPVEEYGAADGSACTIEPTDIRFAYDEGGLYIAARCTQSQASLTVTARARDEAVHRDDCVGFFFCPDSVRGTVFQIYVNPAGAIFDQRIAPEGNGAGADAAWNGQVTASTHSADGAWTLEAAIPFATLEAAAPAAGSAWRINFRRKEIALGGSADWQVPIGYDPAEYGYLRFE